MIGNGSKSGDSGSGPEENDKPSVHVSNVCRDFLRGACTRESCRYVHEIPPKSSLKEIFRFCHDFQNKGCFRPNCKFIHSSIAEEEQFYMTGMFPRDPRSFVVCQALSRGACTATDCKFIHPMDKPQSENISVLNIPPPSFHIHPTPFRDDECPTEAKFRRFAFDDNKVERQCMPPPECSNCEQLNHMVKLLHDNISVLLKKVSDLTEKNAQLTSMNEFLLEQTASLRTAQPCVITSRHGSSAPVSLATVSMTPVVSLAGAIPALVPGTATPNLALAPAASRAQLLTPAPQILTVSTTQQLMGNSGTLIVTSAGAQQLMQVSDSGTLMGAGQTVVAVTPAQLTLAPPGQQLMSNAPQAAVQQLVQQSAQQLVQPQLTSQHQAQQFAAAQQSVQHLAAARQSAQQLAAAQQSAQQLAVQQSAQQLAAQQTAQQQLVAPAQQLVHQSSTQQITISNTSQALALPNSQAQPISFPMISQSILPH